jgi:hypothetical protein
LARNKTNFGWPCSNSSRSNFTFYAFSFVIVLNTYKLRVIAGRIKVHFFPQIFTMTDFHTKISKWLTFPPKISILIFNFPQFMAQLVSCNFKLAYLYTLI